MYTHIVLEQQWPLRSVEDWARLLWLDHVLIGGLLLCRCRRLSQDCCHCINALPAAVLAPLTFGDEEIEDEQMKSTFLLPLRIVALFCCTFLPSNGFFRGSSCNVCRMFVQEAAKD